MAGAAVGTATGGVIGALVGMGIPEFEAKRREGNLLLSVHTEDGKQRSIARGIFKRHNADDISSAGEANAK